MSVWDSHQMGGRIGYRSVPSPGAAPEWGTEPEVGSVPANRVGPPDQVDTRLASGTAPPRRRSKQIIMPLCGSLAIGCLAASPTQSHYRGTLARSLSCRKSLDFFPGARRMERAWGQTE